jgi:hypothetical protein
LKPCEAQAFFHAASPAQAMAITRQAIAAQDHWRARGLPRELVLAAASAQVELAIIAAVFPEKLGQALRPSWEE